MRARPLRAPASPSVHERLSIVALWLALSIQPWQTEGLVKKLGKKWEEASESSI